MSEFSLLPFQIIGAEWLSQRKVALLADEMGLGKSAQAISACDRILAKRILVVCPSVARINWQREFEKFSVFDREFQIIDGYGEAAKSQTSTIISYDSLVGSIFKVDEPYDALIIDEVHMVKTLTAKRSKEVFGVGGVVRRAKRVYALSGTPAPNHSGELWILLYSFGVTKLKYDDFIDYFCITQDTQHGPKVVGTKPEKIPELKALLEKIMLRRKIDDVMTDLPKITFSDVVVEPSEIDIELHQDLMQYAYPVDRRDELKKIVREEDKYIKKTIELVGTGVAGIEVLEGLAKSVSTLRRYCGLQKVKPFLEIIRRELTDGDYQKIVIFAVHKDVIEALRRDLSKDFDVVTLYGGTPPEKRQAHIDRFQTNPRCRIFIGQVHAAGTNITLTAANQVAFIEQDWVPGNNAQAAMRCRRIGQKKPVFVRFFGMNKSCDYLISQVLKRKSRELVRLFDDDEK